MTTNKKFTLVSDDPAKAHASSRIISDVDAEMAVRQLIEWIGEDPSREGLQDTPRRFLDAWKEFYRGYQENPRQHLQKNFTDVGGYKDAVTLQNISFETHCEHHLVPFVGEAFISYIPNAKVVGISKLVRVLDGYARRMQIQERLTAQVAAAVFEELGAKGVAVAIRSEHSCMTMRGVHRPGSQMLTTTWLGDFETNKELQSNFMSVVNAGAFKAT